MTTPLKSMLKEHLESFMAGLGLANISADQQQALWQKMLDVIGGKTFMHLQSSLAEEQLSQVLSARDNKAFIKACQDHGINIIAIAEEEAQTFREELLSHSAYVQGYLDGQRKA